MNTAAETEETELMANIRHSHMRNIAAKFLADTPALHLERELVDFLVHIDRSHQKEVQILNALIEAFNMPRGQ